MVVVLPFLVAGAIIAAVGAAVWYGMKKMPNPNEMKPLGLGDFQITQCNEGEAIPLLWGTKKITGNIVWYGNLVSVEQSEDVGGKGMGGGAPITGYQYYMDIWQGLCWSPHGGLSILNVYSSDKEIGVAGLGTYYLNPGNTAYFPTEPGVLANKMPGMAHIFLDRFDLGVNASFVPNLAFVLKNTSPCPLTYANMTTGINPAAIVYDILTYCDVVATDIDLVSFQAAANYWYNKDYGLNIVLQSQKWADEMIAELQTYVDFGLYQDDTGKWILTPFTDADASVDTINTEDVKDFKFNRKTWDDTTNDFRATYTDEDQDYSQRNITIDNIASINLIGHRIDKSIDLSAFNQVDTASKRLAEIMKGLSYPNADIQTSVPYRFITRHIGDVLEINNTDYGIVAQEFRLVSLEETDDANYVKMTLTEKPLFDDTYALGGGTLWVPPDNLPRSLSYQKMFELPFSESLGTAPTFLCLGQRKGCENGFAVYSTTAGGGDPRFQKNLTTFSTKCVLGANYLKSTGLTIDDTTGILLTPHRFDPEWATISRTNLFSTRRVLVCGNELMTFETIVPEGVLGAYRLKGVMRGVLGTPVEDHTIGSEIWIADINNNTITMTGSGTSYWKFVPYVDTASADITTCSVITATTTLKAVAPLAISRCVATRVGVNVSCVITPAAYQPSIIQNQAGTKDSSLQTDSATLGYFGYLQYKVAAGSWVDVVAGTHSFNYNQAGAHTLHIRYNNSGVIGQERDTTIGAGDAVYVGPEE